MEKHDVIGKYNLPREVMFCKRCTVSNQRPRIKFDKEGVCSACRYAEHKKSIDWEQREKELAALCNRFRKEDGAYDVIVPGSGGKDSGFVSHLLKYKYGMNPLAVTWSPEVYTDIGWKNIRNWINIGGFDHILSTPNGSIYRRVASLGFKYLGDVFLPFLYGVVNFPLRVAVQQKISLIMLGEHSEVEYGGDMSNAFNPTRRFEDHDPVYFSGLPPIFWEEKGILRKDLMPFMPPTYREIMDNKTEAHYMGYYRYWDPQENYYYCVENTGLSANPERSEGTYSKYASLDDKMDGFHYYMGYIKFGIGRATSDSAHEIRDEKITREEGVALVKKFDGEFPQRYFSEFLDYCSITESEFHKIVDSWRSDHLWQKKDGKWTLKHTVWHE